jgi:hypothetical protein
VTATPIVVEATARRAFAWAVDWPGWCRGGKDEGAAIAALADYRDRYAVVAEVAAVRFPKAVGDAFDVIERVAGNATTDFGAPNVVADADRRPLTAAQAKRDAALLVASWQVLDDVAATASPTLRRGPRGGGRDRDDVVRHVIEAEHSYGPKLGIRRRDLGDRPFRDAVVEALRAARSPEPVVANGWPPRTMTRRMAWHVLDHAWEIEDKSL